MPYAAHKMTIDASFETVRDLLIDKMEKPKKYVGGILYSSVKERGDGYIIREMYEPAPANLMIREKIYHHPIDGGEEFVYEHLNNARYTGVFRNVLTRVGDGSEQVEVEYIMDWTPHAGTDEQLPPEKAQAMVSHAVAHLKHMAENPVEVPAFVRDFFDKVDAMDCEGMGAMLDEQASFRMGNGPELLGRERIVESSRGISSMMTAMQHDYVGVRTDGEATFVECFVHYELPNGATYLLPFLTVFEQKGDKISSVKVFGDMSPLQHGWPAPPQPAREAQPA